MAFALVQGSAVAMGASGTSVTVTLPSNLTVGNLVTVFARIASTSTTISSVTDPAGNTYTIGPVYNNPGTGLRVASAYAVVANSGAGSVTITFSSTTLGAGVVDEWSGGETDQSIILDTSSTGGGASGTARSVTSFSPALTGNLIVAGVTNSNGTLTAGTNYTKARSVGSNTTTIYRLSSSTSETAPATNSTSSAWAEVALSFYALGTAPTPGVSQQSLFFAGD